MSLTDDWKAKKIDTSKRYWVIEKGVSKPTTRLMNELGEFIDGFGYPISRKMIKEVLAPCDYDHLVELTEKVKKKDEELQWLKKEVADMQAEINRLRADLRDVLTLASVNSNDHRKHLDFIIIGIDKALSDESEGKC